MDTLQKKLLGWAGFGLIVLLGIFLIVKTNTELETATTTNTVSFSGTGKALARPDIGLVDLSIVTEGATSKAAQDANSKKSNAVTDVLKKTGIEEKDIKTTGYSIYPQYNQRPCIYNSTAPAAGTGTSVKEMMPVMPPCLNGYQSISSYSVSETVQVKVRDVTKLDDVLAGVVSAGANQVNQIQLTIDDPEKLKDQAREDAIKEAGAKAKSLEHQLGIRLGHVVNFTEDSGNYYPMPMYMKSEARDVGSGGATPSIATGENEISVSVTITYQIK